MCQRPEVPAGLTRMVVAQRLAQARRLDSGGRTVTPAQNGSSAGPSGPGPAAEIYQAPRQDKPWGHEVIFAGIDGKYVGKIIHVTAGHALSLQYHLQKEETISVLSGAALIEHGPSADDLSSQHFGPGDTIHLPPGAVHRITAITDLTFAEASTAQPGWREDVVRLEDHYGRTGTSAP
jgi:mannose-6-phosphate isomerase